MGLTQKQTHRWIEQTREPRNKHMLNGQLINDKRGMQRVKESLQ